MNEIVEALKVHILELHPEYVITSFRLESYYRIVVVAPPNLETALYDIILRDDATLELLFFEPPWKTLLRTTIADPKSITALDEFLN